MCDPFVNNTSLHEASINGNVDDLHKAIRERLNVDIYGTSQKTPLHYACEHNNIEVFRELVKLGGNVHLKDYFDNNCVNYACKSGNIEMLEELLRLGVNIQEEHKEYPTPLCSAITSRKFDVIDWILDRCDREIHKKHEMYLFREAIDTGDTKCVEILINLGLDINFANGSNTALTFAFKTENPEMVDFIMANGYVLMGKELECSAVYNNYDYVKKLIDHGVNIEFINEFGKTALHLACNWGSLDTVELVLSNIVEIVDPNNSLINCAVSSGKIEIVEKILSLGFDINVADDESCTPLGTAINFRNLDMIKRLVELGAIVDEECIETTKCCYTNYEEVVTLLQSLKC